MEEDHLIQKIKSIMNHKPNNENLIEKTLQQMIDHGEIPIKHESKNREIATKKIDAGNKIISTAPLNDLIKIYSEAIAYAPCGSEVLARAYANRSAALTNGGFYEDSLIDIKRAFESGYPDNCKAKLYARKAKNLLALNPTMRSEINEVFFQAHYWKEKMDDENKKKISSYLEHLENKSFKEPVKKWDDSLFMPKMSSENPKILRASDMIDIRQSDKFGRHIVATKNIKAGEALLVHKAYLAILMKENWHSYCWNCFKFTFSCVPCNQCSNVIFCNEKCRDEAWKEHHDIECPVIVGLVALDEIKIEANLAGLRILIKALKEYGNLEALYKKVQELDQIKDPIDKSLTGGIFDDTKYASVYALLRKDLDVFSSSLFTSKSVKTLYVLAKTTEIFGKKIDKINELKNIDLGIFVGKLLIEHMTIVQTNSITMMPNDHEGNVVSCGGVLLPLLSLFSHSCDCNAYQYASGNVSVVIPIQPIKKGEQVCISYGMYYREASTPQRRQILEQKHRFWCECMPCNNNWSPNYRPPSCLMQSGARKNMNKLLQNMRKYDKFPPIIQSYKISTRGKSPTEILKTISEILDLLNTYDKYVNYPCAEIEHAKNLLLNVYTWVAGY